MADVLILCYPAVSPGGPVTLSGPRGRREPPPRRLPDRASARATRRGAIPAPPADRTLAVTFDDGFRSVHRLAAPIMRELGVPGTLFVPTGLAGAGRTL